jgi:hypothetical protein
VLPLRLAGAALLLVCLWPARVTAQLVVDGPPSLAATADRIRAIDRARLRNDLQRAGLALPPDIRVTLLPDDDPRARDVPRWVVGLALGQRDIVILPNRVLAYPYDSLESVVRHEVTHLALTARAGGAPLPRWFHEGVATSVDAGWSLSAQVRLVAAMLESPDTARLHQLFTSESEGELRRAYLLSAVLVEDLRRRHGADLPGRVAAAAVDRTFEEAFQAETAYTPDAAAARAWEAYRRWTEWIPAMTGASALWALILCLAFVAYLTQMRRRVRRRQQWEENEF